MRLWVRTGMGVKTPAQQGNFWIGNFCEAVKPHGNYRKGSSRVMLPKVFKGPSGVPVYKIRPPKMLGDSSEFRTISRGEPKSRVLWPLNPGPRFDKRKGRSPSPYRNRSLPSLGTPPNQKKPKGKKVKTSQERSVNPLLDKPKLPSPKAPRNGAMSTAKNL